MTYAFPPPPQPAVPVAGADLSFPVHRIYCVGRNYAEHAREMGGDPEREPPFFFTKPADAVVPSGSTIPYPLATGNLHHEVELVVAIGKGGARISREAALGHVYGYAVGLDLTRRDLQAVAKDEGRPWDTGKAFDRAAPMSRVHPVARVGHPAKGAIWLEVNGARKQEGDLSQLVWPVADVIAFLSQLFELAPGDLVFTGTPAGVGPVNRGDRLAGGVDGVDRIELRVAD